MKLQHFKNGGWWCFTTSYGNDGKVGLRLIGLKVICFHILHFCLWETVHPEGTLSPRLFAPFLFFSFFLFCRSSVPGHQTANL